jgi:hypothetical protein
VLRNKACGCFGHNINKEAALARSDYLVLLNNDTEVTPFWLCRMLDAARADPTIGVVGNRQLYPGTGNINHAGVVFDEQYRPRSTFTRTSRPIFRPPTLAVISRHSPARVCCCRVRCFANSEASIRNSGMATKTPISACARANADIGCGISQTASFTTTSDRAPVATTAKARMNAARRR